MDVSEFLREYPFLYHMAEAGSWPSVSKHGLLSTSALLDLFEVQGDERRRIENMRRAQSITIHHPILGDAVIRDQNPLNEAALAVCLQDDLLPEDWYKTLNSRVFFWAREHRLRGLLNARLYRDTHHDVMIVDTSVLVEKHRDTIVLCPYNSGSTLMKAVPRGKETFKTIADYPIEYWRRKRRREAIVEVAVIGGVPDIGECVVRVERRRGANVLDVLHDAGFTPPPRGA